MSPLCTFLLKQLALLNYVFPLKLHISALELMKYRSCISDRQKLVATSTIMMMIYNSLNLLTVTDQLLKAYFIL